MKTDLILKFKQNLFSKVIWSSTFKLQRQVEILLHLLSMKSIPFASEGGKMEQNQLIAKWDTKHVSPIKQIFEGWSKSFLLILHS